MLCAGGGKERRAGRGKEGSQAAHLWRLLGCVGRGHGKPGSGPAVDVGQNCRKAQDERPFVYFIIFFSWKRRERAGCRLLGRGVRRLGRNLPAVPASPPLLTSATPLSHLPLFSPTGNHHLFLWGLYHGGCQAGSRLSGLPGSGVGDSSVVRGGSSCQPFMTDTCP